MLSRFPALFQRKSNAFHILFLLKYWFSPTCAGPGPSCREETTWLFLMFIPRRAKRALGGRKNERSAPAMRGGGLGGSPPHYRAYLAPVTRGGVWGGLPPIIGLRALQARGQQGAEGGGPRLSCVCACANSSHACPPSPLKFSG